MAAANDSQGLKIAVASFVSLSVILAVTTYFMYSNYSTADAKATEEARKSGEAQRALVEEKAAFKEYRQTVSPDFANIEDAAARTAASKKETERVEAKLNTLGPEMLKSVSDAQTRGAKNAEIEKTREISESIISAVSKDPSPTLASRIDKLIDLIHAEGQLIVAIANDNADLRLQLEGVNKSNDEKVRLAQDEAKKARDEQVAEHSVYEGERKTFLDKIDSFQKLNGDLAAQLAGVKETLDKTNLDNKKKVELLLTQLKQQHNQLDKKDSLREKSNGSITYVDYTNKTVRTTLTTRQGARPPMRLAVFDKNAQGLPTEKPKATIELISVDNRGSYAKIIEQANNSDPLHINDQVYSIAIGNREFALVGKMDMNRDGKDDRADVKRLIEMSGGKVVFDLPPAGKGHETGKLTASVDWIITDELPAIYTKDRVDRDPTQDDKDFMARRTDILREAQDLGIRPLPLFKLASFLGYSHTMNLPGRVETLDKAASFRLQNRKGNTAPAPAPAPAGDAAKPEGDAATDTKEPEADPK